MSENDVGFGDSGGCFVGGYRSVIDSINGESELSLCARSVAIGDGVGECDFTVEVFEWLEDVTGGVVIGVGLFGEGASGFIRDGAVWVVLVGGEGLDFEGIGCISVGEAREELLDGDVVVVVFCGVGENGGIGDVESRVVVSAVNGDGEGIGGG